MADPKKKKRTRQWQHFPDPKVTQYVGFLACLCDIRRPEHLLILSCFPAHLKDEDRKEIVSTYHVVSLGQGTSDTILNKGDRVNFCLPETYTLLDKENAFVR